MTALVGWVAKIRPLNVVRSVRYGTEAAWSRWKWLEAHRAQHHSTAVRSRLVRRLWPGADAPDEQDVNILHVDLVGV